jgi:preprotein translocase subunit YajC
MLRLAPVFLCVQITPSGCAHQRHMKDRVMSSLVAVESSSGGSGSLLIFALPVLLIGFMFITQRRRQKAVQNVQSTLGIGDEITTTSGLIGRITALDVKIATLEVSPGVSVRFDRRAIAGPAPTASAPNESQTDRSSDPTNQTD